MATFLTYNIAGTYETAGPFCIKSRSAGTNEYQWTRANVTQTPDGRALMLTPVQMAAAWPSADGKLTLSDYTTPTGATWEALEQRGANDWFLQSRGTPTGPVVVNALPPINQGFCLEIQAIAAAKTLPDDLYIVQFGTYFTLHIHGSGKADLWDSRVSAAAVAAGQTAIPAGSGRIAPGDVTGKFNQIYIVPMCRGRILVWSSLGPWFSTLVGLANVPDAGNGSTDPGDTNGTPGFGLGIVTQSDVVTISTLTGQKALFAWSNLQYPASGTLTSPPVTLPNPVPTTVTPSTEMLADQEFASTAAVTLNTTTTEDGLGNTYAATLGYTVALTSSDLAHTPFVYTVQVTVDRALSMQEYTSNEIVGVPGPLGQGTSQGGVLELKYEQSKDRGQDSAFFLLDNPTIDGIEKWTSLVGQPNKGCTITIDVERNEDGSPTDAGMADPDWAQVEANGALGIGAQIVLWQGYGTTPEFDDKKPSRVSMTCDGQIKKLNMHQVYSSKGYDGWSHLDAMVDVARQPGLLAYSDCAIDTDFVKVDIFVVPGSAAYTLDSAQAGDDDDRWMPADGTTCGDMLDALAQWGGSEWDFIQGCLIIGDYGWKGFNRVVGFAADLNGIVIPNIVPVVVEDIPTIHAASVPNGVIVDGPGAALPQAMPDAEHLASIGGFHETVQEPTANVFVVVGLDPNGNNIVVGYEDKGSISDPTASNYLGERRLFELSNSSISSVAVASQVCAAVANVLAYQTVRVDAQLMSWVAQVVMGAYVLPENYRYGNVTNISVQLAGQGCSDRYRRVKATVELTPQ